jgi:protein-disulfide isomerase
VNKKHKSRNAKGARAVRAASVARQRQRQRNLWISGIAVVVLLLAGLTGWAIYASQQPVDYAVPASVTADEAGLVDGDGPVTVEIWLDFHCPACQAFDREAAPVLDRLVDEGAITRVYYPVAFLDRASTTEFSTRSASSAGCAADGGAHEQYIPALLDAQPPQGGAALSDDQLIGVGESVGLTDPAFAACVREQDYHGWTRHTTDQAARAGVTRTPTLRVDGEDVPPTVQALQEAVQDAQAGG